MAVPALPAAEVVRIWEEAVGRLPAERALRLAREAAGGEAPSLDALARLPLGERDRRVLGLRAAAFGRWIDGLATCPGCAGVLEISLDAADLVSGAPAGAAPGEVEVEVDGVRYRVRAPTTLDVLAILSFEDPAEAARTLLERCVRNARRGGEPLAFADLGPGVIDALDGAIAALDPDALIQVGLACPECGASFVCGLDPGEFVGRELAVAARRTFAEVDVLARAYGWTEPEILALGAERRRAYLALAAG